MSILGQTFNFMHNQESIMANRGGIDTQAGRIEREVARERHERELQDDAKSGLAPADDFRNKDARERDDTSMLNRHAGR